MKALSISLLFVLALATNSFSQADGKWSVGVGVTPFADGFSSALYINRHVGDRWQIGVMPLYRYSESSSGNQTNIVGLNFNSRFYLTKWTTILPYAYGFTGYFKESYTYFDGREDVKASNNYWDLSLGLGAQLPLWKSGWSLDANVGYFGDIEIGGNNYFRSWFYSFGIFKRFGKTRK